jgi:hypothetical protein
VSTYRSSYRSGYATGYRVGPYVTELGGPNLVLWYDGQDTDLQNNASLTDGGTITTWKNKGVLGSVADLAQGNASLRPVFRLVATAPIGS